MARPLLLDNIESRILRGGDKMTGALQLKGAPTADLEAATKKYVDDNTPDTANAAMKLAQAKNLAVSDNSGTNTGPATAFDGSADATMKLPATIKATLSGNASSATALTSKNIGSDILPVYFNSSGKPVACSTTKELNVNISGNAATATLASEATHAVNADNATNATNAANATEATHATEATTATTCSGNAATATKLASTTAVGSATKPIYFTGGQPAECGKTLAVDISGNAATADNASVADYANHAEEAAFALNADRANFAQDADFAYVAQQVERASYADFAATANYVDTANYANNASSASFASSAATATKATQDGSGNTITTTYATKTSLEDYVSKSNTGVQCIAGGLVIGKANTTNVSATGIGRIMFTGQTNPLIGVQAIAADGTAKTPYYFQTVASDDCLYLGPTSTKALKFDPDGNMTSPGVLKLTNTTASSSKTTGALVVSGGVGVSGNIYGNNVYGAVWNDYAEFRDQKEEIKPGYCVASTDNGQVYKTTEKFQACDGIVSDTFGFAIGETDECKTPLAVAGRVLAYCEGDRYNYHSGDTVCAGPEGKVVKMTREEIREYPDRIIGIVSEIPEYEIWGTGNVAVNGRIWIKVK